MYPRQAMQEADGWFLCRVGFVETVRPLALAPGGRQRGRCERNGRRSASSESTQALAEHAAALAIDRDRRLDSLHPSPLSGSAPTTSSSSRVTVASTLPRGPRDSASFPKRSPELPRV